VTATWASPITAPEVSRTVPTIELVMICEFAGDSKQLPNKMATKRISIASRVVFSLVGRMVLSLNFNSLSDGRDVSTLKFRARRHLRNQHPGPFGSYRFVQ